jgi:tryptophanyl-tRNA synthetase
VFLQSQVPAHVELGYLLESTAYVGELGRMIQFKEKGGRPGTRASLFSYPCLMAADILLYDTDRVPVGDDQRQHIELMRDIAERFNARFGDVLVVPNGRYPEVGARVMDLQDPETKMSTTGTSEQGTVYVLDEPAVVTKKLKSAVTDSGAEVVRAPDKSGISNLIEILAAVRGSAPEEVEREFDGSGYGAFKSSVADAVVEYLAPVRERYQELRGDEAALEATLAAGADKARAIAVPVLADVREAMAVGAPR